MKRETISILKMGLWALVLMIAATAASAETVGFRGDGAGRYGDASPVLEWGVDNNVIWQTELPSWGNASPVIWGGRIFITGEPATLFCIEQATGKILWQRDNSMAALASSSEEVARIAEVQSQAAQLDAAIDGVNQERRKIRKALKSKEDEELKARGEELKAELGKLEEKRQALKQYARPRTHEVNGYASATPVTDGKHVWAVFATGTAVCYDLDGNLVWSARLEGPPHEWGGCSSPRLAAGKMFVHIDHLWALDATTGEKAWKVKLPWGWGSTVPVEIGGVEYIFTAKGNVVRAADGKVLSAKLLELDYNGPVIVDGAIYYMQHDGRAYKLPETIEETTKFEELWQTKIKKDRYYGCPLIYEGLIYLVTRYNHFSVVDEATGELVYEKALDIGKGQMFPSITLGGKHIFISSDNGTTIVLEPGREYKEVARNTLGEFRTTPVFDGARMYVRTRKHMYCIGAGE